MITLLRSLALSLCFVLSCAAPSPHAAKSAGSPPSAASDVRSSGYPPAPVLDALETHFGTLVHDPYRWLEDASRPDVKRWTVAEDALARAHLANLPDREPIAKRLRELVYVDERGAPQRFGGRLFYDQRKATEEKRTVVCVVDGVERVILDANRWPAADNRALRGWVASRDGKKLAYTVSVNNADASTMYLLDVDTLRVSTIDVLPGADFGDISFTPSSDALYYVRTPLGPSLSESDRAAGVDPMHARKFVAALQAATTGGPALLRIERGAGHEGSDGRMAWVEEAADKYAFALAEIARQGATLK